MLYSLQNTHPNLVIHNAPDDRPCPGCGRLRSARRITWTTKAEPDMEAVKMAELVRCMWCGHSERLS